jgi:hypothetical protein
MMMVRCAATPTPRPPSRFGDVVFSGLNLIGEMKQGGIA